MLDLLHVTPRLWEAAHLFHPARSQGAEDFVRQRVLRILRRWKCRYWLRFWAQTAARPAILNAP